MGLKADGTLWAWGNNTFGQLGVGGEESTTVPVQVGADAKWTAVSAGCLHTVAVKADGTLWAWGRNVYGQLGNGSTTSNNAPALIYWKPAQ
jgi:alpha-tubulin suppressor-like RCC1 family protein